jgi:hypothetical protein
MRGTKIKTLEQHQKNVGEERDEPKTNGIVDLGSNSR